MSGGYFNIQVDLIMNLSTDLRKLRWFEELGQVCLYMFLPTRVDMMVTINGVRMTQNQWIYREVTRVVSADRVALFNRYYSRLSDPEFEYGRTKNMGKYMSTKTSKYQIKHSSIMVIIINSS